MLLAGIQLSLTPQQRNIWKHVRFHIRAPQMPNNWLLSFLFFFGFSFPTSFPPHMQPPTWFHSLKQPMVKSDKHFDFAPGPSGSRTSEAAIHL